MIDFRKTGIHNKSTSSYYNDMFSPIRIIDRGESSLFFLIRVYKGEQVTYNLALIDNGKVRFEITLISQELNCFLSIFYEILSEPLVFYIRKDDFEICRLIENRHKTCSVCGADTNLISIKILGCSFSICELCAEQLYYQLDDLSFNYKTKKPY